MKKINVGKRGAPTTLRSHHAMMIVRGVVMYQRFEVGESVLCVEGALVRVAWLERVIPPWCRVGHTLAVIGRWTSYGLSQHWRITLARRLNSSEYRRIQEACPTTKFQERPARALGVADIGQDFG